ncbi:hypothetical protein SAMN04488601_1012403 [Paenibacillus sp. 453mf]|nr:hypothetical protein SAMN04488601_1012403 [Paenibacillus sp. 453mf]
MPALAGTVKQWILTGVSLISYLNGRDQGIWVVPREFNRLSSHMG